MKPYPIQLEIASSIESEKTQMLLAHPEQLLVDHLLGVAKRADEFATHFNAGPHAATAGFLHDLGKADPEFQKRIRQNSVTRGKRNNPDGEKRPHSPHGAALALDHHNWPAAFAIFGHHAGLHNRSDLQQVASRCKTTPLECVDSLAAEGSWHNPDFSKHLPEWLESLPFNSGQERDAKMRAVELFTRMLFSALVDADRLDTEEANPASGSQTNSQKRGSWRWPDGLSSSGSAELLIQILDTAVSERAAHAKIKQASEPVMEVRAQVLNACNRASTSERGVFTLAVPTGGAKTLSSLSFAIRHIAHQNKSLPENDPTRMRRIIIVIPFLNIIQQTTRELQKVFGDLVWVDGAIDPSNGRMEKAPSGEKGAWIDNPDPAHRPVILEHHSQASDPEIKGGKAQQDVDGYDQERPLRQLAAENWDAPIIITTSVQFFDSLFSRRPSDARKLHNICQSVIIFDEVQTLPPLLLQPILDVLKELTNPARPYGCSLVLCTATQPALENEPDNFPFGFERERITPIINNATSREHFAKLKRVQYHGLDKTSEPPTLDNDSLVDSMRSAPRSQALVILNTRKQARSLFETLRDKTKEHESLSDAVFHLSTWMYPAHRLAVLAEVSNRLAEMKPCLLVATQCIEAGVDVDFPAVWRAFGPYDSIVQAAGRCNRNGSLKDDLGQPVLGQVHVFAPADATTPQGTYASAMQTADLLRKLGMADPENPVSFETYFRLLYQTTVPDPGGCAIQSAREKLHFEEVSKMFNFIDSDSVPLLVESAVMRDGSTVEQLFKQKAEKGFLTRNEWREIQPYIVNLSFPTSKKTKTFLEESGAPLAFKDDDPDRGLRLLKNQSSNIYSDGLNGSGLNFEYESLRDLASYVC